MLLYGDNPPADEPTLELLRRPLPADAKAVDAAGAIISTALERWGWEETVDAASGCLAAVLRALTHLEPDSVELFAYRRAHQLTIELHFTGHDARFHQLLGHDPRLAMIDSMAPLWGVRPLGEGEAVWFEFSAPS